MDVFMDKLVVTGGTPLNGTAKISGSKNAVLPIMTASLLAPGRYTLTNVPDLRDVRTMGKLLESIGATTRYTQNQIRIEVNGCRNHEAPYNLVKTMRASIYVLGPLLARFGEARVSLPGGCAWGPRPVNLHIDGLKRMGASIDIVEGYIVARSRRLHGARIPFDVPSVGATAQLLMAAVTARGSTVLENAAREPEITSLAQFLVSMGARIAGIGTDHLNIEGVDSLSAADAVIIPDRIETGTFLIAGHLTGGKIRLENAQPEHNTAVLDKLEQSGARISTGDDWIELQSDHKIRPVNITTAVFPGFPTDMQAQWMALMTMARGTSLITDAIFIDRFTHVAELQRMGAEIILDHNTAVIKGVRQLTGAPVMSTDLRASASLILAALVARGKTDISRVYHIDRGYERIEEKLKQLGADIRRDVEKLIT